MNAFSKALALAAAGTLAAGLGGCVNPSERIATSLERYGLDPTQAQCVGDRLEAHLSIGQLQQLSKVVHAARDGSTSGHLTAHDLLRGAAQLHDPRIPLEVAKAAAKCGVLTDPPSLQ